MSVNTPPRARADASELIVNRWSRYGKHRLYVNAPDGTPVGWVDLDTGERSLAMLEHAQAFEAAVAAHSTASYTPRRIADELGPAQPPRRAVSGPPSSRPDPGRRRADTVQDPNGVVGKPDRVACEPDLAHVSPQPVPASEEPWTDLATNVPGQAARARAKQELAEMRERKGVFLTFLARGLDARTDERSWRIGADGEETVGARLEKLRADGWQLLHSVPVGNRDSDIDHVLIGPGGVFTINTKTHPKANIWVSRATVMVSGHKQPYLRNSRFEADRAARLLSRAVGWTVAVTPALVFLTDTFIPQVTVRDKPDDVLILDRLDLPRYFRRQPPILTPTQVDQTFAKARRSTTWR